MKKPKITGRLIRKKVRKSKKNKGLKQKDIIEWEKAVYEVDNKLVYTYIAKDLENIYKIGRLLFPF
jgi:hypothetical protein